MEANRQLTPSVAIVGGGITGLAAARELQSQCPGWRVKLFERRGRLGGVLHTVRTGDYLIETSADNFLRGPTAPWAEAMCRRMGFDEQLIPTNTKNRGAHIAWRDQLHRVPAGFQLMAPARFWPILKSPLLSLSGKLRLCCEPLVPHRAADGSEPSVAEFATRRLGREAYERLVEPLVAGIYTADARRLSAPAAVPQMVELVEKHGSLYRGMRSRQRANAADTTTRGARYSLFAAPRDGMSSWIAAIQATLTDVEIATEADIRAIRSDGDGKWSIDLEGADAQAPSEFDAVILALPTYAAAATLAGFDRELSDQLHAIRYANSAVVCMAYPLARIRRQLDAFGCVVPTVARRRALAISYSSLKYAGRAPDRSVLLRVFLGGDLQPEVLDHDDATLIQMARDEVEVLLGAHGDPELERLVRWPRAMPQYDLGHDARVVRMREAAARHRGLFLAGNGYQGVGIPQCIRSGEQAAQQTIAELKR